MEAIYTIVSVLIIGALVIYVYLTANRRHIAVLFIFYMVCVLAITVLLRASASDALVVFNPFKRYKVIVKSFYTRTKDDGFSGTLMSIRKTSVLLNEIVQNILLFIPFGFLLPISLKPINKLWKVLICGLAFSFFIETIQLMTHRGCFDVSDLIHNSVGAIVGFMIFHRLLNKNRADYQ